MDYVYKSCNTTMYPSLCYTSLSPYADSIQSEPKLLANASLFAALSATKSSSKFLKWLAKRKELTTREAHSIVDCIEEVGDSIDELKQSMHEITRDLEVGSSAFEFQMSDIQTWVSAALTDDDTCLDGLDEVKVNPRTKNLVRQHMVRVAQLTSNALALVNNYAKSRA
ncbi:pectinesterase inhibitor 10-like [Impatiens glandulifera]|uniref:pectinesterase inhibitor 10-like n=1 Tax=Impatiens glandulifera TaxID=253017 RepID=UPI001FB0551D|nr:pectinesterase inhibitor 10-like [Impatiens glandulifera]